MKETPSQTAGPYLHIGLSPDWAGIDGPSSLGRAIFPAETPGTRIRIGGTVLDGEQAPLGDVLIEVWQADAAGRYAARGAEGWGRVTPDRTTGAFSFETIRPGAAGGAPHLNLWIVARGINLGLHTRLYFDDAPENATDPVLSAVPPERRHTLIARSEAGGYRFDIALQGSDETVFFDI